MDFLQFNATKFKSDASVNPSKSKSPPLQPAPSPSQFTANAFRPYKASMICGLHVQIADVEGMFFDEFTARFDFVSHQNAEHFISGTCVLHRDLE